jgi:hypothetical protein
MSDPRSHLEWIRGKALVLSEAYRLRLVGILWWANLLLVVTPAAAATAAAYFAGESAGSNHHYLWTGILAGGAAVLVSIHKALKCEEYQAECLRLSQSYQSIAIRAAAETTKETFSETSLEEITQAMATLVEGARAPLPNRFLRKAKRRTGYSWYDSPTQPPKAAPPLEEKRVPA